MDDMLAEQWQAEWLTYGDALAAHIEARWLTVLAGVQVPVTVVVDADAYRMTQDRPEPGAGGAIAGLIEAAVMDVPTPAELPGTPLERLDQAIAWETYDALDDAGPTA